MQQLENALAAVAVRKFATTGYCGKRGKVQLAGSILCTVYLNSKVLLAVAWRFQSPHWPPSLPIHLLQHQR